ncbi:cytochrome c-type biogenesis protein CcmH [Halomonas sp. MCCC 1A11036]|uniref:Cytochrome c-type biogenesis protein n=1 Tax=Billgrantia zhangzhouensis TaxID=2733481 RepID=A0ABS9AJF3_9GAMM|nr:cytochrome c-type biogenesis protein [Halomonas zhangzhouensis]MCE8021775.1 cytochrome c-type biogenesis protein CcmH [Halomonas zhangzhouensis]
MKRFLFLNLLGLPLWLVAGFAMALAIGQPIEFDSEAQKRQYDTLVRELRCTVCQSETIHESNAELAADMRRRVYDMTVAGHDADAIVDFMVQRYGDYVRYRPPLQANTWLLWASPFLLMFGGALVWWRIVVGRQGMAERPDFTDQERAVLERLRHDV